MRGGTGSRAQIGILPIGAAVRYVVCGIAALVILVPLVVAVVRRISSTNGQLLAHPFSLPEPLRLTSNYSDILGSRASGDRRQQPAGHGWDDAAGARARQFGRVRLRAHAVSGARFRLHLLHPRAALPATVAILPLYLLLRQLGLVDTLWGIILPQVAFALPVNS